jgi:hypothetical protein
MEATRPRFASSVRFLAPAHAARRGYRHRPHQQQGEAIRAAYGLGNSSWSSSVPPTPNRSLIGAATPHSAINLHLGNAV